MEKFQDQLVNIIKEKKPDNIGVVELLTSILSISKEAAYRRLRGEINFTLDVSLKLARELDISLDSLVEKKSPHYIFETVRLFDPTKKENPIDNHCSTLEYMISCIKKIKQGKNPTVVNTSSNLLTHPYVYKYPSLSKFRLLRFSFIQNTSLQNINFSNLPGLDRVMNLEQTLSKELLSVNQTLILNNEFLKEYRTFARYYHSLGLLSEEDIEQIKNDLTSFYQEYGKELEMGKNEYGATVNLYVPDVKFTNNYTYFYNDNFATIAVHLFGFNLYSFDDKHSIQEVKNCIEKLMSSSVLVSFSGARQRIEFLEKQDEIISSFLGQGRWQSKIEKAD